MHIVREGTFLWHNVLSYRQSAPDSDARRGFSDVAHDGSLRSQILEQRIALEYADELDGVLGTSSGGCIRLLNGLSPAMEFTTLVHEHAHLCSAVGYVWSGPGEVATWRPRARAHSDGLVNTAPHRY